MSHKLVNALTTDSEEAVKQLNSLETIVHKWSQNSSQLSEENRQLSQNYNQLEEKFNDVLKENKRLSEECKRLTKKLKTTQNISRSDAECQTEMSETIVDSKGNQTFDLRFNDKTEIYILSEDEWEETQDYCHKLDEKTIIESRKSEILCNDSSEALDDNCDDLNDPNGVTNDDIIDEIPESLDNSVDNNERNDTDFYDIPDSLNANNGLESVETKRNNLDFSYESSNGVINVVKSTERHVNGLNNRLNGNVCPNGNKGDKYLSNNKIMDDKVIKVTKDAIKNKTLSPVLSQINKSPIKLVIKTLGPVVRTKSGRKKLNGFSCKECEDYYRTKNLSETELKNRLNICSRHRYKFSPPKSPEHFWETDIPSTPECIRRGIFNIDSNESPFVTQRKKQKSKQTLLPDFCKVLDKKETQT